MTSPSNSCPLPNFKHPMTASNAAPVLYAAGVPATRRRSTSGGRRVRSRTHTREGVPQEKEEARRGTSTHPSQESLQTFSHFDFDERHFGPRLPQPTQAGWRGQQRRADHDGRRFPHSSQNAALADWKGMAGKEMPPGLIGIQSVAMRRRHHDAVADLDLLDGLQAGGGRDQGGGG